MFVIYSAITNIYYLLPRFNSCSSGTAPIGARLPCPALKAEGQPMATHKFNIGQMVRVIPNSYISDAQGKFDVVSVLPEEHGMHQYRIKSATDERVHVVMETELV
jgi:hypothetical protein